MRGLADLLVPSLCAGCRRPAHAGLCSDCIDQLAWIGPLVCGRCGSGTEASNATCQDCRFRGFHFDRARQAVAYESLIRKVIHRYKYSAEHAFAEALASLAVRSLGNVEPETVVTWVPSISQRVRRRGFDHGRSLAEHAAALLGLRSTELLEKIRPTRPQMQLEPWERRTNLEGAFRARVPSPDQILVIDDVYTTGATASEAARALKAAGASNVFVAAVARTPRPGSAPSGLGL